METNKQYPSLSCIQYENFKSEQEKFAFSIEFLYEKGYTEAFMNNSSTPRRGTSITLVNKVLHKQIYKERLYSNDQFTGYIQPFLVELANRLKTVTSLGQSPAPIDFDVQLHTEDNNGPGLKFYNINDRDAVLNITRHLYAKMEQDVLKKALAFNAAN